MVTQQVADTADPTIGTAPVDRSRPIQLSWWLFAVAAIVFAMVVIGGATRLTQSGLSITTWDPVSGAFPPLTDSQWAREFDNYRSSPQYEIFNNHMDLAQFKGIFWWEWAHRLVGRIVGLALVIPLAWFLLRRAVPPGYGLRLVGLAALVGLQGLIGWWMVASGLVDRPEVAHERLAIHLCTALFLLAALVWTALDLRALGRGEAKVAGRPRKWVWPFLVVLFIQFILGAFLAGLRGGHVYNTWPQMNNGWMPPDTHDMSPMWTNAVNNPIGVQFLHRWWALVVALFALWIAAQLYRAGARRHALALESIVLIQFVLGVLTLVNHDPIDLAVIHQGVGTLVLVVAIFAAHWSMGGARRSDAPTAGRTAPESGASRTAPAGDPISVGAPAPG